ncbi:MAG: GNAT family N-acetyltransferase [Chlamydiales bacterium]|nr:GNAT family N-acetyltransferase [Chlamydiales bacterium]
MTQTVAIRMVPLDWQIPVEYPENMEGKTLGQTALELSDLVVDWIFCSDGTARVDLAKRKMDAEVILSDTVRIWHRDQDDECSCLGVAFKVFICFTIFIPALIAKTILRAYYSFEEERKIYSQKSGGSLAAAAASSSAAGSSGGSGEKSLKMFSAQTAGQATCFNALYDLRAYVGDHTFYAGSTVDAIFNSGRFKGDGNNVFFAEEGIKNIGFIVVGPNKYSNEKTLDITRLVVHPDSRRKGVATQLLNEAIQYAKSLGKESLTVYLPSWADDEKGDKYALTLDFVRGAAKKLGLPEKNDAQSITIDLRSKPPAAAPVAAAEESKGDAKEEGSI